MAIPFVAIQGYHTLLESRAGKFVEEPTRADPGWRAIVDATLVTGVAEIDRGVVTGVALVVHNPERQSGGTVILAPGSLELAGSTLTAREPQQAVTDLAAALRLGVSRVEVLDDVGWSEVLGAATYTLENPDPVPDNGGGILFEVGQIDVGGSTAAAFLGRPAPGAIPISVRGRRQLFWNAVVDDPPTTNTTLANELRFVAGPEAQVVDVRLTQELPVALLDGPATESLIRDVVAFPTGAVPGDRLQVRILDRTGTADLEDIAAAIAAQGIEVIEIGNAAAFDDGATQVIVPVSLAGVDGGSVPAEVADLSRSAGPSAITIDPEAVEDAVVTVVIGRDFDLANLY